VPDRQADEEAPERAATGGVEASHDLRNLLVSEAAQPFERARVEMEDVADVVQATGFQQRYRCLVAQSVDVERTTAGEVEDRLAQLRGTRHRVGAPGVGLTLGTHKGRLALGALRGHHELGLGPVAQCDDRPHYFRDDVAGASYD